MTNENVHKQAEQFHGSGDMNRDQMSRIIYTQGINMLLTNGASWAVSDAMTILKMVEKVRNEEFVAINIKSTGSEATITYTDGNENTLYTQKYGFTDMVEGETKLFFTNNTLMLAGEY